MINYYSPNIDLILIGCGFLGGYHLGAICLLRQIWPEKSYERIAGASCGGILGAVVMSGVDLLDALESAMGIIRTARKIITFKTFKFRGIKNLLRDSLSKILPKNAHKLCSSRFGMTIANLWTQECVFVSEFETRQELIDCVVAGSFIPFWSGQIECPKFRGKPYMDGGFIDNKPRFEYSEEEIESGRRTIGLCPFPCEVEVCPKTDNFWMYSRIVGLEYKISWDTIVMGFHCLFPCKISTYKQYFLMGHTLMKEYLLANDFIKCQDCYATESKSRKEPQLTSTTADDSGIELSEDQPKRGTQTCLSCLQLREKVDSFKPPEELMRVMDK